MFYSVFNGKADSETGRPFCFSGAGPAIRSNLLCLLGLAVFGSKYYEMAGLGAKEDLVWRQEDKQGITYPKRGVCGKKRKNIEKILKLRGFLKSIFGG